MPQIPSGGGSITALMSPWPSSRMSINDLRSSARPKARRNSRLSKGGFRTHGDSAWLGVADHGGDLVLDVLHQWKCDLVGEGHVELPGDKAEHGGRAVRNNGVLDTVEIRQA